MSESSTAVLDASISAPPAHSPQYSRLTISDLGVLLKLHRDGKTQVEIAQRLGCTQPTVAKRLAQLTDSTDTAKAYLRGQSLRMARNIVRKGRAADHVAALKGLSVLEESVQSGLTIVVGGQGNDVRVQVVQPQQIVVSPNQPDDHT